MARPTITIERLPGESTPRYQARTEYILAGADRSLDAVSQKLSKSLPLMKRWSAEDDWTTHARRYDETQATLAAQEDTARYLADLEAHRKRASDSSLALYQVASNLLRRLNEIAAQPSITIEAKDGQKYKLPGVDLNANTLAIVARAYTTALDLEAHALGIDKLLPSLQSNDSEQ